MLHGFVRTLFPSLFESSSPYASGFDHMPRLHYILADHLHLCYSYSLLSFHHRRFCEYFSCIFLPNLRILVPDRIVSFDQALLASSCNDFSFFSFFWLSCCWFSASLFSFPFPPTLPSGNQYIYFLLFPLFLVLQGVSLKLVWQALLAYSPDTPFHHGDLVLVQLCLSPS